MAEYTLSYTGVEIDERLSKIDSIDASVETAQNAANSAEAHSENAYNYASYAQEAAFNVADAMAIPDYVQTEARRVAKNVHEHQGVNTITFLACSDIHYSTVNNVGQMTETLTHMGQAMKIIRENVAIDFAVCLGDSIWDGSNESVEDTQEAMRRVNSALFDAFNGIPNFRLVGNHEVHYNGSTKLTDVQIFANTAAFNAGATFDESNRIGGYCYRDFQDRKLRVVCLNTSEGDQTGSYVTSDTQRTWLENTLNLSSLGSGWKSLVLSHIPLDWFGASSAPLSVVNAASGVICNVHGHIHNYLAGLMAGSSIPRLGIPNGCFYRANEYGENGTTEYNGMEFGETTTYNKTAGTANDTAFCVVTIDFDNEVIYADHYGAGYDRVMTFDGVVSAPAYSVTYALTNVTAKTNVTEVEANGSFTNDLTANNGYEISSVTVTMGGVDITSSAYDNGLISIDMVTGNIVITASATAVSTEPDEPSGDGYTNLVSTSVCYNSDDVYNATGYKNGYYASSESPYENTDSAYVLTGLIPYNVGYGDTPPTIYVKGATFDMTNSHTRIQLWSEAKAHVSSLTNTSMETYFTIEELENGYYAIDAISNGSNMKFVDVLGTTGYIRFSLNGTGDGLIVTTDNVEGDSSGEETTSYTNVVLTSIDTDGSVYNGTGYQTGYRLNSSGTLTALGDSTVSGFIPYNNEVIRAYGGTTNPTNSSASYVITYDDSFTMINGVNFYNFVNSFGGVVDLHDGKYILTADPSLITNATHKAAFENATYIRVNFEGCSVGANFVVTLDEEIS